MSGVAEKNISILEMTQAIIMYIYIYNYNQPHSQKSIRYSFQIAMEYDRSINFSFERLNQTDFCFIHNQK